MKLYRAADDDVIVGSASFSEDLEAAELYMDNPGYGGSTLYQVEIDPDDYRILDLTDCDDEHQAVMDAVGIDQHPGAIGVDEWVPQIAHRLSEDYDFVRVRESYPADSITWIFLGDFLDMEEINV